MKTLKNLSAALVGASLIASPVVASAAPVIAERAGATVEGEQLGGLGFGWIIAALVAIGVAVIIISDEDETDPVSP